MEFSVSIVMNPSSGRDFSLLRNFSIDRLLIVITKTILSLRFSSVIQQTHG